MTPHRPVFQSFVATGASATAVRLCRSISRDRPSAARVLILHGPTGVGKSHLLQATAESFGRLRPDARVVRVAAIDVVHAVTDAIRADRFETAEAIFTGAALVIVDDLHELGGKPATQEAVARLLIGTVDAGARVVGATTGASDALRPLFSAIRARVPARECAVRGPVAGEMRAIVRSIADAHSVRVSGPGAMRIARESRGDVRRVMGAIAHLHAQSTLADSAI